MSLLPEEYLQEPTLALAGGVDGMFLIKKILDQAKEYLRPGGALVLEIGNEYEHFIHAFPGLSVIWLEVSSGQQQVLLVLAEDLP
jgi:ribosomal protein L3 glutamine methyltransferase